MTGKIVFGAVGRLFWVKVRTLSSEPLPKLHRRDDVVLLIVGEGPEREYRAAYKSSALGNKVILTGQRTDIAAVMATFDALLHPSLAESFGLILVEAMALGKPVAATKFGIAPRSSVTARSATFSTPMSQAFVTHFVAFFQSGPLDRDRRCVSSGGSSRSNLHRLNAMIFVAC